MESDIIITVLSILFLILLSGFFSGSETSLTAASAANMHKLSKGGNKRAALVEKLIGDLEKLIGAILLGNNLVNILASALATSLFIHYFGDVGVVYATIAMTVLVLVFAEVLPKTYAISNPDRMALWVSPPINLIVKIFSPLVQAVLFLVRAILRLFGLDITENQKILSPRDEIRGALDLQAHEGLIVKKHKDMLSGLLDLQDINLEDVMIHRRSVEMINLEGDIDHIIEQIVQSPHTRIPLWKDNQDNIIGIIHAKDLLREMRQNGEISLVRLKKIAHDPWFVPETTSLQEQLEAFLKRKTHFALVVDEYGSFMGVITLEDILEEIVGEIIDEHDTTTDGFFRLKDGSVIAEGTAALRDLNREFNWNLFDEEAITIAGHVIEIAGEIPRPGEVYQANGFAFRILKRHRNQITSVKIFPLPKKS